MKSLIELVPHSCESIRTVDWESVICRATNHPQEASYKYHNTDSIENYLTLHVMMKWDPPVRAVGAVLRAYPEAVLSISEEGSPLQIACELQTSVEVIKLLVVAHISLSRKMGCYNCNPIQFITEPAVSAETAALLLDFYPQGALQRGYHGLESPLTEIIDDYSRDYEDGSSTNSFGMSADENEYDSLRWAKLLLLLRAAYKLINQSSQQVDVFRPVHALLKCITLQECGLQECGFFGVLQIIRTMKQNLPKDEFTKRDSSDRLPLQILVEEQYTNCCLCKKEAQELIEFLVICDPRSSFKPRKLDGRLLSHIAFQNGWPCRNVFLRKAAATCA